MLEPRLCRTFLAVAELGGFSAAARRLGLRQSTVSQHVRRLEQATGRPLFARDTHSVELTVDGEAMRGFAQSIVDTTERAQRHFAGAQLRGTVRFGASEDLVLTELPQILLRFRERNPLVNVELTVELSDVLAAGLDAGRLDLAIGKRRPHTTTGRLLWREPLVWIGSPATTLVPGEPVPLVQYPMPSITRQVALESLQRNGFSWRSTCQTSSLAGLRAAAAAGLGITVHARSLVPEGLRVLPEGLGLPDPGMVEFVLMSRRTRGGPVAALSAAITDHFRVR